MILQSIVIPVRYQNNFPKFECNVIDLCTTSGQLIKNCLEFPFNTVRPHYEDRGPWERGNYLVISGDVSQRVMLIISHKSRSNVADL